MKVPVTIRETVLLPFYLVQSSVYTLSSEIHIDSSELYTICAVTSGEAVFTDFRGKDHAIGKGSVFYLLPFSSCIIKPLENCMVNRAVFSGDGVEPLLNFYGFKGSGVLSPESLTSMHSVENIFSQIKALDTSNLTYYHSQASTLVFNLINKVGTFITGSRDFTSDLQRLEPALRLIDQHFGDDITVNSMAEAAGISVSMLYRLFKTTFGTTPIEYLNDTRIENASRLLLSHKHRTAAEIAVETGFHGASYFGKIFKRKKGVTPSEYREKHKK